MFVPLGSNKTLSTTSNYRDGTQWVFSWMLRNSCLLNSTFVSGLLLETREKSLHHDQKVDRRVHERGRSWRGTRAENNSVLFFVSQVSLCSSCFQASIERNSVTKNATQMHMPVQVHTTGYKIWENPRLATSRAEWVLYMRSCPG